MADLIDIINQDRQSGLLANNGEEEALEVTGSVILCNKHSIEEGEGQEDMGEGKGSDNRRVIVERNEMNVGKSLGSPQSCG